MKRCISQDKFYIYSVFFLTLFIILITFIQSCKKIEIERVVKIETGEVSNVQPNSAIVSGNIIDAGENGISQYGHCWSSSIKPTVGLQTKTTLGEKSSAGNYSSSLSSLSSGTKYLVRAYATSGDITVYGDTVSFTTDKVFLPTVTIVAPTNITENSATCGGNVESDGGSEVTARGVCWDTHKNPTLSDDRTTDGNGLGSFTSNITGLSSYTTYYVRAYATNNAGTAYSSQDSFKTSAYLPTVTTAVMTLITDSSAQGGGDVTSDGGTPVTAYGVCWSTYHNPELTDSLTIDGSGTGEFVSNITGLSPGTTYYVRAYATNSLGTNYGDELAITTNNIITWEKTYGGGMSDEAYYIEQTTDKGFIIAGFSWSFNGDVTGNHGYNDYWIVKTTSTGVLEWQKSLGGSNSDLAMSVHQTTDGGYIVAGESESSDGDVSINNGSSDYWVVKLTSTGDIDWEKSLGGSHTDKAFSIQQTNDGGYIVAGMSWSIDGDVSENIGSSDYWIVKLTSAGDIDWEKSYGGSSLDRAYYIQQTTDEGYIVAGYTTSDDIDVSENHGDHDYWIVKLTSAGDIDWEKSLGGSDDEYPYCIQQTTDGGYVIAGYSESIDGDVSENLGASDYWIVKLTSAGDIDWQKSYGGSDDDLAYSIQQTTDGGYIVAGTSRSLDNGITGNHGETDILIIKITSAGVLEWQKPLGGSSFECPFCIQQIADGSYIVAGYTESVDGDVTVNQGNTDYWIIKLPGD